MDCVKGTVYSIQGRRVEGYTVYRVQREVGRGYIMSRIWHAGHRPCELELLSSKYLADYWAT